MDKNKIVSELRSIIERIELLSASITEEAERTGDDRGHEWTSWLSEAIDQIEQQINDIENDGSDD